MFIGDKKFACATCIKGHRSSTCAHSDRPLIEVKKKGRPVTQCEHCRDLRKTKQVHVKCNCVGKPERDDAVEAKPRRKKARITPPAPSYSNGLNDLHQAALAQTAVKRESNTCNCDQSGECHCASQAKPLNHSVSDGDLMQSLILAVAAEANQAPIHYEIASQTPVLSPGPFRQPPTQQLVARPFTEVAPATSEPRSCCNPSSDVSDAMEASPPHGSPAGPSAHSFSPIPQDVSSMFRCCCGATCACPGCTEHQGIDALTSTESCPTSCSACFDCSIGAPTIQQWIESSAAALPEPPLSRKPFEIDAYNTMVYAPVHWRNEEAAQAAGLVKVPQLCCGGKCGCPPNACSCLDDCCGCCSGCGCDEHKTMPHYSGYQGTLRCSYQVSGERASCCTGEDSGSSSPGPSKPLFLPPTPFAFSSDASAAHGSGVSSYSLLQQRGGPSSYAAYRRDHVYSPLARADTPPDSPLPRVPFQPAPGAFTLGQPNPQLFSTSNPSQPVYHPPVGVGGYQEHDTSNLPRRMKDYRDHDPSHLLERVRG